MKWTQTLFPPENARTSCPPGHLRPGRKPLLLIPSLQRSGTHLLIDTILNNFRDYKRTPLYVNLDRLEGNPGWTSRLIRCGGYIVKTHYPQIRPAAGFEEPLRRVIQHSRLMAPVRDLEAVYQSSLIFGASASRPEFDRQVARFQVFWEQFKVHHVAFDRLTTPGLYPELVAEIGSWIDAEPNARIVYPFPKNRRWKVYTFKALTRLLGRHSPIINTTIAFAKKK